MQDLPQIRAHSNAMLYEEKFIVLYVTGNQSRRRQRRWIFDSGASEHFTENRELLLNAKEENRAVIAADQAAMDIAVAEGVVKLDAKCCSGSPPIEVNKSQLRQVHPWYVKQLTIP